MVESLNVIATHVAPAATAVISEDRSRKVVISRLLEDHDPTVWCNGVGRVLCLAVGRDIYIDDAFRLSRYNLGRMKPILVKLNSIWDRRLILSGARYLKDIPTSYYDVYITAYEPLEARRRVTTIDWRQRRGGMARKCMGLKEFCLLIVSRFFV